MIRRTIRLYICLSLASAALVACQEPHIAEVQRQLNQDITAKVVARHGDTITFDTGQVGKTLSPEDYPPGATIHGLVINPRSQEIVRGTRALVDSQGQPLVGGWVGQDGRRCWMDRRGNLESMTCR